MLLQQCNVCTEWPADHLSEEPYCVSLTFLHYETPIEKYNFIRKEGQINNMPAYCIAAQTCVAPCISV